MVHRGRQPQPADGGRRSRGRPCTAGRTCRCTCDGPPQRCPTRPAAPAPADCPGRRPRSASPRPAPSNGRKPWRPRAVRRRPGRRLHRHPTAHLHHRRPSMQVGSHRGISPYPLPRRTWAPGPSWRQASGGVFAKNLLLQGDGAERDNQPRLPGHCDCRTHQEVGRRFADAGAGLHHGDAANRRFACLAQLRGGQRPRDLLCHRALTGPLTKGRQADHGSLVSGHANVDQLFGGHATSIACSRRISSVAGPAAVAPRGNHVEN